MSTSDELKQLHEIVRRGYSGASDSLLADVVVNIEERLNRLVEGNPKEAEKLQAAGLPDFDMFRYREIIGFLERAYQEIPQAIHKEKQFRINPRAHSCVKERISPEDILWKEGRKKTPLMDIEDRWTHPDPPPWARGAGSVTTTGRIYSVCSRCYQIPCVCSR